MDKNAIKKFAVWARRELISRVTQKALQYGITETGCGDRYADSVNGILLSAEQKKQRSALVEKIEQYGGDKKAYEQVIEEVAYTWFNRFTALRFMEVNGYLPTHIRVFTDDNNEFKPQILTEAIHIELEGLKQQIVFKLKEENKEDELYKYLLITQCNALNSVLPVMFQKIADYTELLFPDNLLREGSVIDRMIAEIPEGDWQDAVQIIGWLYQYYNIEPKDKVFADLKKNIKISRENIPAATQLFTPDWIVRYMVENSLGKLWVEGHPNDELKGSWKYYIEEAEQEDSVKAKLDEIRKSYSKLTPTDIKCIDPCMGSGHILVYLFDVLMQIYATAGYNTRDSVRSIVENNLYGLDIDERATQLAYFAVMMKACAYDSRFLTRGIQPHIYAIRESNDLDQHAVAFFCNGDKKLTDDLLSILNDMADAKEYGSILQIKPVDFTALYARFEEIKSNPDLLVYMAEEELLPVVRVAEMLSTKYDVVVTNPPYMGSSGMSAKLGDFVKSNYPDSKADLFAVFIEVCGSMLKQNGMQAMITQHAWMFLSSFEKLRRKVIDNREIDSMLHLGARAFDDIGGEVVQTTSFVLRNAVLNGNGVYFRLVDSRNKEADFLENKQKFGGGVRFVANATKFQLIPGKTIAYWLTENFFNIFYCDTLEKFADARIGMVSGDNDRFLRLWHEVDFTKSYYTATDIIQAVYTGKKWFPLQKGGGKRYWYGNLEYVVNYERDGYELKFCNSANGRVRSHNYNGSKSFMGGITWNSIGTKDIICRISTKGYLYDAGGPLCTINNEDDTYYFLGLLSSLVSRRIYQCINPTINFTPGTLLSLPIKFPDQVIKNHVQVIVGNNIEKSKQDWDSFETSWDFKKHPLI